MVFSIPSYLGLGDRYKKPIDARAQGATFLVSRPKTGHQPDALFDKTFRYMWNGERGGDMEKVRRQEQQASAKRYLTNNGFSYTNRTRRPEGLGSYFGCFQSVPHVHIPEFPEKHADRVTKAELEPRGIYTSPGKKGGYGFAGLALSDLGNNYMASVYDQPRINERLMREEWRRRMPEESFRPAGRRGFTFDESLLTGASKCYMMTMPFKEKAAPKDLHHFRIEQPWRPAGYVDNKPTAMEYWEDPYGGYDPRADPKSRITKPSNDVFRPSSCSDTFWYTQSVVFKRL